MSLEEVLAFITPLSNCTTLLRLDWRRLSLSKPVLPLLEKLLRNNPVIVELGCIYLDDVEIARELVDSLSDITNPLTVYFRGISHVRQFLADLSDSNPLLRFRFHDPLSS